MNNWVGMGRLTKAPEIRNTNETTVARYSLAIDRRTKEKATDFIPCVCFGKVADFAEKYLKKGMKVAVEGHIQTGNYTNKDGKKVYTMDVIVSNHYFCESKGAGSSTAGDDAGDAGVDEFMSIPADIDDEVPFK